MGTVGGTEHVQRMHHAFREYVEHLKLTQKAPLTIRRYQDVLLELGRFTRDAAPDTLNKALLLRFAANPSIAGKPRTPAGFNLRVAVLRSAFRYLLDERLVPTNPAATLAGVREPHRTPKFLTLGETMQFLRHVARRPSVNGTRDLVMVTTLWQTALRVSELTRLTWEQVEVGRRSLSSVRVKGGHFVDVALNVEAVAMLVGYRSRCVHSRGTDPIFATRAGRPISARAVEGLFETWRSELGWTRPLHPHVLRHTHATGALALGTDIATVADLLRHHGLRSVMVYATVQDGARRAALAKLGRLVPEEILKCYAANDEGAKHEQETACVESPFYELGATPSSNTNPRRSRPEAA